MRTLRQDSVSIPLLLLLDLAPGSRAAGHLDRPAGDTRWPHQLSQATGAAARCPGCKITYPGGRISKVITVRAGNGVPSTPKGVTAGLPGRRHTRPPVFSATTWPRRPRAASARQRT